jgi:hypothetical protein
MTIKWKKKKGKTAGRSISCDFIASEAVRSRGTRVGRYPMIGIRWH